MLLHLILAWCLVAITVMVHAAGVAGIARRVLGDANKLDARYWQVTWLLVRIAWQLIVLHAVEIAIWALFYWWQ